MYVSVGHGIAHADSRTSQVSFRQMFHSVDVSVGHGIPLFRAYGDTDLVHFILRIFRCHALYTHARQSDLVDPTRMIPLNPIIFISL